MIRCPATVSTVQLVATPLYLAWWLLACAFVTWEFDLDRQVEYFRMAWSFGRERRCQPLPAEMVGFLEYRRICSLELTE
jgi:hypothetical protein